MSKCYDKVTSEDPGDVKVVQDSKTLYTSALSAKGMSFGEAITALKAGLCVARAGWNGKGMFLWLKPESVIQESWCKDPMLKELCAANGGSLTALGTICMFTADHKVLTGWLASQTDMLSSDWMVVRQAYPWNAGK